MLFTFSHLWYDNLVTVFRLPAQGRSYFAIMKLLDSILNSLPIPKKNEPVEYYFGLNISPSTVYGCVWGIRSGKLHVLSSSKTVYESEKDLVEAANFVLDEALADFQPEPTKILFGVPDDWLADDDLKPEYLKTLKQLVKELDVVPLAYVASTNAIAHLIARQTGVPLTAILVHISDPVTVSVIKTGKVQGTKQVKKSDHLAKDIEKALMNFTEVEVMPSKIIIYGDDKVSKYKEDLTSYAWMTQLPFLHLPKIEDLDPSIVVQAVAYAGASEIDPEVHVLSQNIVEDVKSHSKTKHLPLDEELHHGRHQAKDKHGLDNVGFVTGDIADQNQEILMEDEELGGGEDVDVYGRAVPMRHNSHSVKESHQSAVPALSSGPKMGMPVGILGLLGGSTKLLIIPLVLLVLVGVYMYFQKAKVTVFVDLKTVENTTTVTADPKVSAVDESNKIIPGEMVSAEVSGNDKGQATGKKQVGDAAKGKVIIYNATDKALVIDKGTTLTNDKGLKFTLDGSVQVASKSASAADPPTKSSLVDATASVIGPDSNIPAGGDLSVGGFNKSDVVAKVDTAFSGGVSKDVTVVTADDQNRLLAKVLSDLKKQAKDELQSKMTGDVKVLEEALSDTVIKKTFSKNVGDQASDFTLNLTVKLLGTSYKDSDLKSIVSKLVQVDVPAGYDLDLSQTETQADVSKVEKDGRLVFSAKFKAKLMPKFDLEQLKKDIAFKSASQAADRLKQIENVIGSDIEFKPDLPGPLERLPILTKNIDLEVTAK